MYNVQHFYSDTQNIILNTVPGAGSYCMYSKDFINLISHESLISRDNSSKGAGGGGSSLYYNGTLYHMNNRFLSTSEVLLRFNSLLNIDIFPL